jgi:hypothetical protein
LGQAPGIGREGDRREAEGRIGARETGEVIIQCTHSKSVIIRRRCIRMSSIDPGWKSVAENEVRLCEGYEQYHQKRAIDRARFRFIFETLQAAVLERQTQREDKT